MKKLEDKKQSEEEIKKKIYANARKALEIINKKKEEENKKNKGDE